MLRRYPILVAWMVTACLPAAEPAPDPTVALVDKSDAAFLGHVKAVAIEEATLGPEDAADLNSDTCVRRISDAKAPFQFQAGKSYQFLVAQLVVDDLVKGEVMRGSTLKVRVAASENKEALGAFDIGWGEKPSEGQSKWETEVPGGRLFALKADPDGLAFRPLLIDFPAETSDLASGRRKSALAALCKAYRGKPGFALPETLSDEDILTRLHATKVEKLDGGKYRLTYDFSSPEELKDWYAINPLGVPRPE